jgi:hypothetical protein
VVVERLEATASRGGVIGFFDVGQYLEREVMIAHDELIARQRIQGVLELGCLRNGEIAGIRHSIVLTLQQCLARCLGQKSEGLRKDEGERRRQEAVKHAHHARRRIFLDAENRAHSRRSRRTINSSRVVARA